MFRNDILQGVESQCTFNFAIQHYQGILCQVSDSHKSPEVSRESVKNSVH